MGHSCFSINLGQVPTLVVSSAEMAREIMRTRDHIFAFRPSLKAANILLYDSMDLTFAPYGEYWRQLRKVCTLHLLSAKRVHSFELVREEEVASMLLKISRAGISTGMVDMSEVLNFFTNDVLCRVVSGKFDRGEGRNELFRELIENIPLYLGDSMWRTTFHSLHGWMHSWGSEEKPEGTLKDGMVYSMR